jgi:hypothetical protein
LKRVELQKYIDDAMDYALSACAEEKNPIVAWDVFISRLDSSVRRNLGDQMERNGRNRYTGEPETDEKCDELRKLRKKLFAENGINLP